MTSHKRTRESKKIPSAIDIGLRVKNDAEKFTRIYKDILNKIEMATGLEKFLLSWGLIEQLTLPSLIRLIAHRLSFNELPDLSKISMSQLIQCYYFLSHDNELYRNLLLANTTRNRIVHRIYKDEGLTDLDKKCKESTKFVLGKVFVPILESLTGKRYVPVLILYAKGWNDYRKEAIKMIEGLKN